MSLYEAVKRAGTLEALLPHLRGGSILSRHGGLYWPRGGAWREPGDIDSRLWDTARVDPATGRMMFKTVLTFPVGALDPPLTHDFYAVGIELESAAVDRLFPVAAVPAPRHAGGRDPDNDWEGAARHVDDWVAAHGPLPRHKDGKPILARAVELMAEWFDKNDPPPPQERSFRRWIRKNPRSWWGPN
jgi:hypothetical protein